MAVLALHNLAVHRLLPAPAGGALNLATAAGLTTLPARRVQPAVWDRCESRSRMRFLARAAVPAAASRWCGVATTRRFFGDRRVSDAGRGEAAYHLAVRIPLATALAEELLFRGVLLGLFRQRRSPAAAVVGTSLLFGAWHVLPTLDHYQGNPASDLLADPGRGRRLAVLATTLSTTGAGGVFAWLRLRSGSVLAPVLAHASVNVWAYLAGRLVVNHQARSGGRAGWAARAMEPLWEAL